MATNVTFNGSTYSIPGAGELNWSSLSNFVLAVGNNAQTTTLQKWGMRVATASPVTVAAATDCTIVTKLSVAGAVAVNLPAGVTKQIFCIVDGTGDAATNNITITPNGAETINGAATLVLSSDREGVVIAYSGTEWVVLAKFKAAGSITDADVSASAAIAWTKISKSGSNLTDIATRSHTSLTDVGTNSHAQIDTAVTNSVNHIANTSNPHSVTKTQVGLGNVADAAQALASDLGQPDGIATLNSSGKLESAQIPDVLVGAVVYQGTWNASTNTPTLASGVGAKGNYYIVSADGSTDLDGITDWKIGDYAIFSGTVWQKIDNTDQVASVAGKTGVVTLVKGDVGLGNVDNTSDVTKDAATATLTNKTIVEPVIDNFADINEEAAPGTPASGKVRLYAKTDKKLYIKDDNGVEQAVGSGSGGSGEKNYITNPSAASSITGWNQVGDLDVARTTTASELPREFTTATGIKITADANTQSVADYVYEDFTLDDVDLNKKLKIQWSQKQFGAYVAGNLAIVITTQADRTTAIATPDVTAIPAYDGVFTASFDTASTATLSLVIRATTDMATDTGIVISDVIVGPGQIVSAAASGYLGALTVTVDGNGSKVFTNTAQGWRQPDGTLRLKYYLSGNATASGSAGSTGFVMYLPAGYTIDSTRLPAAFGSQGATLGRVQAQNVANSGQYDNASTAYAASSTSIGFIDPVNATVTYRISDLNVARTVDFNGEIVVPIAEWAGAPNYAGSNDVIYISNDGTNTVQGPQGSLVPNQAFTTGFTSRTITLPRALQAGEIPQVFISNAGNGFSENYYPFASGNNAGTTNFYGVRVLKTGATTVRVDFGNQGTRVSSSSASNGDTPWSTEFTNGTRFLVVIGQAGNTVGFGAATSERMGLISREDTGTWTPTSGGVSNITGTPTFGSATYNRFGRQVTAQIKAITGVSVTTAGSGNTFIRIVTTGLPSFSTATAVFGSAAVYVSASPLEMLPAQLYYFDADEIILKLMASGTGVANSDALTISDIGFTYTIGF